MVPQSLPRTHPFFASSGRLFRVVESDGVPSLEDGNGYLVDRCYITGPEILKLSGQGRVLWRALDALVRGEPLQPWMEIARDQTAATFDHNEEVPRGDE